MTHRRRPGLRAGTHNPWRYLVAEGIGRIAENASPRPMGPGAQAGTTWVDCFVASAHIVAFSRHVTPEFYKIVRPENKGRSAIPRGRQGKPGARCTRDLVCKGRKKNAHEHTGSAEAVRPSLRNGFTAYFVLSLVTGFFVTIVSEKLASQKLDASIGASGPHDFAVRFNAVRQRRLCVHRIPPRVRDDREPPLCGTGQPR